MELNSLSHVSVWNELEKTKLEIKESRDDVRREFNEIQ